MIIKYFRGGKSKSGAVEYLLNERVEQGTARVLRGNPEITKQLIKENSNKLKYRSGCLSFEENFITESNKKEIMELFEKSTFAGLDKDQYNILWVEHVDKNRVELNFVIPRLELTSMKAYNPHWHVADQKRLLTLQEYINGQYNLSSPFESSKRELLKVDKLKKNTLTKQKIHSKILEEIAKGHIQNRDELIQYFRDSGATLPRIGKDYITVQFGDEKYRLKGLIYAETFTTIERVSEEIGRTEQRYRSTSNDKLQDIKQALDRFILYKSRENKQLYPRKERNSDRGNLSETRNNGNQTEEQKHIKIYNNIYSGINVRDRDILSQSERPMDSAETNATLNPKGNQVYKSRKKSNTRTQQTILYSNNGVEHDRTNRTRDDIIRGIREFEEKREQVFGQHGKTNESIERQILRRIKQNNSGISDKYEKSRNEYNEYFDTNKTVIRDRYHFRREREELSRAIEGLTATSFEYQRELEEVKRNIVKLNEITLKIPLNYQQKIFVNHYKNLSLNTDFKGFYIKENSDNFQIQSKKLGINIKDYGDRITAVNTINTSLQVKLMLDIAEAKGWDLNHLNIGGNDEFIKRAKAEVSNRLDKKREREGANQYQSRGHYR